VRRWVMLGLAALGVAAWASTASARTAHFQVTVSVSGPGHVTGTGDGGSIDCPGTCAALIRQQTLIVLTATPDAGSQFTGWGGSCVQYGSQPTCTLQISGPKDVTAGFGQPPPPASQFSLTVQKTGTGTGFVGGAGGIDCGPTCTASFGQNAQVTLLAVADDGSTFVGWSGAGCSGTDRCTVTITAATSVTAEFDRVDQVAPRVRTTAATAARGSLAKLHFRVFDDSGHSREVLTILRGKVPLGRVTVPMGEVDYRQVYTAAWRVPKTEAPDKRTWCAVAFDEAGNASKRSCSALRIR
jgi:List-Bact-rpt repeat protein